MQEEHHQPPIFGPQITQVPDYTQYQKPQESQASARSLESPEFRANRYFVTKPKLQRLTRIINIPIPSCSNKLEQQPQIDDNQDFMRLVRKNRLVQKFKSNLFLNSYVLPHSLKNKILSQESYLQSKNLRKEFVQSKPKSSIILPENPILYCWDFISLLANMLSFWVCPLLLSFSFDSYSFPKVIISLIIHLVIDNLISMNRAFVSQGEVIIERKSILSRYLYHNAFLEFVSLVLWILIYPNSIREQEYLKQALLVAQNIFSIIKLAQIYNKLIENVYIKHTLSNTVDLLTLILSIYFFAHLMACLFHYIGIVSEDGNSQTWLIKRGIRDSDVWIRYNNSFYWAAMTITTVGYGDIIPANNTEMIFANVMMFLSSFIFAYSMNSIGIILRNIYERNKNYKKSIIQFNNYMKQNEVDSSLQIRIRNYFKHQKTEMKNENIQLIQNLILGLPRGLKFELHYNIAQKILQSISLITHHFSKNTQQALIDKLKILKFSPQEFVFHQQEIDDQSIYYVKEGTVDILEERSQKILQTLKRGQTFGEYQFFTGFPTKTSAICRTQCEVVKIHREAFLKIISDDKKDWERFAHIKDNILLYQNYSSIYLYCNQCQRNTHLNIDCPLLTYQPDIESIIKKQTIQGIQQQRIKASRNGEKINTLKMLSTIQDSLDKFQSEYHQESEQDFQYISPDVRVTYRRKSHRKRLQQQISISNNFVSDQDVLFNQNSERLIQTSVSKESNRDDKKRKLALSPIQQIDDESQNSSHTQVMLQEFKTRLQFHHISIDCMRMYSDYMTQNNFYSVVKPGERLGSSRTIRNQFKELEKYTFNFYAKQQSLHLKEWFQRKNNKYKEPNNYQMK